MYRLCLCVRFVVVLFFILDDRGAVFGQFAARSIEFRLALSFIHVGADASRRLIWMGYTKHCERLFHGIFAFGRCT